MLGVIFHWDRKLGLEAAKKRILAQMTEHTCRAFSPDRIVLVDPDLECAEALPGYVMRCTLIGRALSMFSGYDPVYISTKGERDLEEFDHPGSPVYIVGPNYGPLQVPDGAASVRINYHDQVIDLHAPVALGIVLHDMERKVPQ